jgi:hypothetical protein
MSLSITDVRQRLAFDIERLASAAHRMERVDGMLSNLKRRLESRASKLADDATDHEHPELDGDGLIHIRYAQAHATAELARRATLGDVLRHSGRLSLIASMAVTRWVNALRVLSTAPANELVIKGHIDAGRLAYRTLKVLRPKDGLKAGCGHLTASVVVAEFVHAEDGPFIDDELEVALGRARVARGIAGDEEAVQIASRAIRAGAELLEHMAATAEPAAAELLARAEDVEQEVQRKLLALLD